MRCRTKETFYCFHFKSAKDLPELKNFLGSSYTVEPLIYQGGTVSERQYIIKSTGQARSERIINHDDWVLLGVLGISGILHNHTFKREFDLIREKKPK